MKYVLYHRLSKRKQQGNQYGIEAQEIDIQRFLDTQEDCTVIGSFAEYYTGKGDWRQRRELVKAVNLCKQTGAILVVAKVDRLGRNTASVAALLEMIQVRVATMPSAENMIINILAVLAEEEAKGISDRVKKSLKVAKEKGTLLGAANEKYHRTDYSKKEHTKYSLEWAEEFKPLLTAYRSQNMPFLTISKRLNEAGKKTIRGAAFDAKAVQRLCHKLEIS